MLIRAPMAETHNLRLRMLLHDAIAEHAERAAVFHRLAIRANPETLRFFGAIT